MTDRESTPEDTIDTLPEDDSGHGGCPGCPSCEQNTKTPSEPSTLGYVEITDDCLNWLR